MGGILVIRGGAIGDFILTLPAIRLLREAFPETPVEILGYKHIVSLAEGRYYARATRSIEYAGLASFFIPGGALPDDLVDYFAEFDQVISYLYDPDGFFEGNLRRAGVENLISGYSRIDIAPGAAHAARQLARPLERLALFPEDGVAGEEAVVHPSADDRAFASDFLREFRRLYPNRPLIAIHPGSGGRQKRWPLEHWQNLLGSLRQPNALGSPALLFVGGEADAEQIATLGPKSEAGELLAWDLSLPRLAAVLEQCAAFIGHDSGISHLAAAVRTPSILLFGPTDPAIWAPAGKHVEVVRAPEGDLAQLSPQAVLMPLARIAQSHPGWQFDFVDRL